MMFSGKRMRMMWIAVGLALLAALTSVLFSPGGVASKTAQLLLELGLVYLIISDWRRARRWMGRAR